jgi:hypothetical protein
MGTLLLQEQGTYDGGGHKEKHRQGIFKREAPEYFSAGSTL